MDMPGVWSQASRPVGRKVFQGLWASQGACSICQQYGIGQSCNFPFSFPVFASILYAKDENEGQ